MGFHNMTLTLRTHFSRWGVFHLVVLLSALIAANSGPCLVTSELTQEVSVPQSSKANVVCSDPESLCFPSTLAQVLAKKDSSTPIQSHAQISNSCFFLLRGGRSVVFLQNYEDLKTKQADNNDTLRLKLSDGYLPNLEDRPHLLYCGEKLLYVPSLSFVTVTSPHKGSVLFVLEPYSANSQFCHCNSYSEVVLGSGETCSICFGALPTSLDISSAHLVLQSDYHGFLVKAKVFSIKPTYGIQPIISWASVFLGKASSLTQTVCSDNSYVDSEVGLLSIEECVNDTFIIPAESSELVALSLATTVEPCGYGGTAFIALFAHNDSPHVLRIVNITEEGDDNSKRFRIKHVEGLMLFPHTVTQVALVSYNLQSHYPDIDVNCKIFVYTNASGNSRLEILCKDIFSVCIRGDSEGEEYENVRSSSLDYNDSQGCVRTQAEEAMLMNWRSQAATSDLSVLESSELIFPVIEVGHLCSEWITIKNPSREPVLVQLILNSAEIVDECGPPEMHFQASSSNTLMGSNNSAVLTRYGFSLDKKAKTEALIPPLEVASLGPVWFRPGSQCRWKSSALIRNNLSGTEWVSLIGSGGSPFMVLLQEDSEPIRSLDFKISLNSSSPGESFGCSQALTREVYAKNMGDLPLRVIRIGISGTQCESDGFSVNSCKGFSLSPGESKKIVISYQTDYSLATLHRDLELSLSNGILVVPMKATLPMHILSLCKKTFLERLRISFFRILLVASILFLFTSQLRKPQDCYCYVPKSGKSQPSRIIRVGQEKEGPPNKPDVREMPQNGTNNLRGKVGNESGRRKRKKKGSGSGGGRLLDVSSSSPLSVSQPETIHKREVENIALKLGNDNPAPGEKKPEVVKAAETPVPPMRAPGSRFLGSKAGKDKAEEMKGWSERFVTYDIWGDHLFGHHLAAAPLMHNKSHSFFVSGPQVLMTNSPQQNVSSDVDGY